MNLNNAPLAILALIIMGVLATIGARITSDLTTNIGQGTWSQNISYAAGVNTTMGVHEFASFMPVIGLVLAAALVIGLVVMAFAFKR